MADGLVQVPPDSTGKKVDAASLDVGANTVMRQRMVIGDDSASAQFAIVTGGALTITGTMNISAMPTVTVTGGVAISGTALVAGQVSLAAGTANIGFINNISATVNVAFAGGISLAAGTANIGFINNISATVIVAGTVSLGAGTANIGTINNISAAVAVTGTVSLGAGTNLIGAVSLAAGTAVFGTLNNISATVIVAGVVSLGAGTANIGFLNNISATVVVAGEIANGASLSTTNKPVLMGGNTSAGGAGGLMVTLLLDTSGRPILGAGTNNIGAVSNAAGTALMGAVSLAAGTANIGFINNISATVTVAGVISVGGAVNISVLPALVAGTANIGAVSLAAGTANFGTLNDISRTVQVAIGTPYILQGISTTVMTAVAGKVAHGVSVTTGDAPVQMGWRANFSAPAANISNGASFGWSDKFGRPVVVNNHPSLLPTASHGPKCVTCSTSAGIALITAPGAGLSVYITQIACTNGSSTLTRADVFQVSATASCVAQMYMAASGGGFVMNYDPPIQLLSNSGATCRVKPSVSQAIFNVHFYVGAK